MNEQAKRAPAYNTMPAVAALNSVPGFEPRKFIRIAKNGAPVLDLKYKKLWFRLACPNGSIPVNTLELSSQKVVVQALVFKDKADAQPLASYIATRFFDGREAKLYIDMAQYEAQDQALASAGFGIQFCDIAAGTAMDRLVATETINMKGSSQPPQAAQPVPQAKAVEQAKAPVPPATAVPVAVQQPVAQPVPQPQAVEPESAPSAPEAAQPEQASPAAEQMKTDETATIGEQPPEAELPQADEPAPAAEQLAQETEASKAVQVLEEPAGQPAEPIVLAEKRAPAQELPFSADMDVDAICAEMSLEQALALVVDTGTCIGWTLEEVEKKRPASLKWYLNGYKGDNNVLRAGAKLILNSENAQMAG